MKPDNERRYMDKRERLQSSAEPVSFIQQKIWPNKWHQAFTEESRVKQASVLWGNCRIWWATLKLIMRCRDVAEQRNSWSWCPATQNWNKRQLLIRLWVNNTFQLHLSSSAIEKKLVAVFQKVSVMVQLEGNSKDACAGAGQCSQHWNENLLQHVSSWDLLLQKIF